MTVNLNHDRFDSWMAELERRHLADLRFTEVSRALRALSSTYVERRGKLAEGAALSGAGKRAAFALFYGPLHFLLVREVVAALKADTSAGRTTLVDLGCGTGAAGAAWASSCARAPEVLGVDRSAWALEEALKTYRHFALKARTLRGDAATAVQPAGGKPFDAAHGKPRRGERGFVAAFTLNEMDDAPREKLLQQLLDAGSRGDRVLIVEPVARGVAPWWNSWRDRFRAAGGRDDEWRFRLPLPPLVQKLDRAASLDHREQTARTLWIG